jgi:hypothetical protein
MPLDPHDELGLPWDDLADGRVHRLIRGRDFVRSADVIEEASENAARRLGRVVRSFKETRWGVVYFWVQFVDHEVMVGDPCPCGSSDLRQVNQFFAECASCKSTVALVRPKPERPVDEDLFAEDEVLLQSLFTNGAGAGRKAGRKRQDASAADPRSDMTRLEAYSKIRLFPSHAEEGRERMYGHGLGPVGSPHLLVVDFAPGDGERIPETVWSVPVGPFGGLVKLDRLEGREPALELDEPEPAATAPRRPPPSRLSDFAEVELSLYGGGKKGGARFRGWGRLPDGETVLMMVQYLDRNGDEPPAPPDIDETTAHTIRCVPLAPFEEIVDSKALFGEEQAERAPAPEPRADSATLGSLRDIVLFPGGKDETRERLYGRATWRGSQSCLVVVDFPLSGGKHVRDAAYPTGWRHAARWVLAGPFGSLIDLDALDTSEPCWRIEDPLSFPAAAEPDTPSDAQAPHPPGRLSDLEDVRLAPWGGTADRKRKSFFGVGSAPDGEKLLLTIRYWGPEDERKEDLRTIPLAPFGDVIDTEGLRSKTEAGGPPETRVAEPPPPAPRVDPPPRIEETAPDPPEPEPMPEAPAATQPAGFGPLRLFYYGRDEGHESFYGHGHTVDGQACLVVVEYAPGDEPLEARSVRSVHWIPTAPFGRLIDLGPLSSSEPALELDALSSEPAPAGLDAFRDIHLFARHEDGSDRRFYGYARAGAGETALLTVRDPTGPDLDEPVRWIPLAPFISVVDLDTLFSATPDLVVDTPGAELAIDRPA